MHVRLETPEAKDGRVAKEHVEFGAKQPVNTQGTRHVRYKST